jgi:large subunit ribosomal protein L10
MRQDKQLLLDEIKDQIVGSDSFVVMRYLKLSANKANQLRKEVGKLGGNIGVMRKRVLIKAAEAAGISLDVKALPGHIGLVYAKNDPLELTKLVVKFGEDNDKSVEVVGGRIDGQLYNAADVNALSKLPGKDEMRAQLLSVFEAPMAQTLAVMDALLSSVVYCLDNKVKAESGEQANVDQ